MQHVCHIQNADSRLKYLGYEYNLSFEAWNDSIQPYSQEGISLLAMSLTSAAIAGVSERSVSLSLCLPSTLKGIWVRCAWPTLSGP